MSSGRRSHMPFGCYWRPSVSTVTTQCVVHMHTMRSQWLDDRSVDSNRIVASDSAAVRFLIAEIVWKSLGFFFWFIWKFGNRFAIHSWRFVASILTISCECSSYFDFTINSLLLKRFSSRTECFIEIALETIVRLQPKVSAESRPGHFEFVYSDFRFITSNNSRNRWTMRAFALYEADGWLNNEWICKTSWKSAAAMIVRTG